MDITENKLTVYWELVISRGVASLENVGSKALGSVGSFSYCQAKIRALQFLEKTWLEVASP